MIEKLIAMATAAGLGGILYMTVPTALDEMTVKEFANQAGVSDLVYDCAKDVLAGKSVEELVSVIEDEAITAGTDNETATAKALRECVYQDPLGWHGTPFEEYIYLLETDKWDDH